MEADLLTLDRVTMFRQHECLLPIFHGTFSGLCPRMMSTTNVTHKSTGSQTLPQPYSPTSTTTIVPSAVIDAVILLVLAGAIGLLLSYSTPYQTMGR